jgi:hypothetical protein
MGFPDISSASNWIDALKWLVPLVSPIATAVFAAIISRRQWKTNQEKLHPLPLELVEEIDSIRGCLPRAGCVDRC